MHWFEGLRMDRGKGKIRKRGVREKEEGAGFFRMAVRLTPHITEEPARQKHRHVN